MINGKTIEKKILPRYYNEVRTHRKMFEIRKDEDNIQIGDALVLKEWNGREYTGHKTKREVAYVLRGAEAEEYGVQEGYCIIGLQIPGYDFISIEPSGERVVKCRDCMYWTDEYVKQNDGRCRQYRPEDGKNDILLHRFVSTDVGTNHGSMCRYEFNRGWRDDHCFYRNDDDFCSRAKKRPCSYEEWYGIKDGYYPDDWIFGK